MGESQAPSLVGLLLLFAAAASAAATPPSHGQLLDVFNVTADFAARPTGTAPPAAVVTLHCNTLGGGTVTIGQGSTGVDGTFNITLPRWLPVIISPFSRILTGIAAVKLPLSRIDCPILSNATTGVLVGFPVLFNNLISSVPFPGVVQNLEFFNLKL